MRRILRRVVLFLRDRWFAVDPRSMGLFRLFFGSCMLFDLLRRLPVMVAFYTNDGVLTNHFSLFRPNGRFSIYYMFSTPQEVAVAFTLTVFVYLMYILGWHTKLFQILAFICVTSLHSRNVMLENGGDVVMNIVAGWSMFLPLGRRFSIDAIKASWREEHTPADLNRRQAPSTVATISLALFAFLLQFTVIYAFNAGKKNGITWREGSAIYWVLHQQRLATPFGMWAGQHSPIWLLRALTWGTLGIEGAAPVLLIFPWFPRTRRWLFLASAWALHIGIGMTTNIKLFQLSMMSFPLLLITAADWKAFAAWHRRRTGEITLVYDTDCGICHQSARLLKRIDPLSQVRFIGNEDDAARPPSVSRELADRTMVVVQGDRQWIRAAAFAKTFRTMPGWAPLGWFMSIPGIAQLANVVYDLVARNRHRVSARLGLAACGMPQPAPPVAALGAGGDEPRKNVFAIPRVIIREVLCALAFIACTSQLLIESAHLPIRQPEWMRAVIEYPRVYQGWGMFSPDAPTDDGTIVIDALTVDGRHIDPLTHDEPVFDVTPPNGRYPMQPQWCDYFNRIRLPGNGAYRGQFRDYILRLWAMEKRPMNDRLVSFDVYWVTRRSPMPGEKNAGPANKEKVISYP